MSHTRRAAGRHSAPSRSILPGSFRSRLPRLAAAGALSTGLLLGAAPLVAAAPASAATVTKPTLSYGMHSSQVRYVQLRLHVHPASGYFGPTTLKWVKYYQAKKHIPVTGRVDAATWRALGFNVASRTPARASRSTSRIALPTGVRVLSTGMRYVGTPYKWGGTTPAGFDCSGFVGYVYRQMGISLPRTAAAIYSASHKISASQARVGDLVFVHKGGTISHVAIVAGGGYWLEATRPGSALGKHKAWTSSVSYGSFLH